MKKAHMDLYVFLCKVMENDYGFDFAQMEEDGGFGEGFEEYFGQFIPDAVLDAIRSLQMDIVVWNRG